MAGTVDAPALHNNAPLIVTARLAPTDVVTLVGLAPPHQRCKIGCSRPASWSATGR